METKILVVDDDALVREFFQTALKKRGYIVQVAEDGMAAVEKLEAGTFDLVIADYKMPRMNGMELLQFILGNAPLTPVIMLTAYASIEKAVEAMRTGAFDYLAKPITDLAQLEVVLKRAVQYRRLLLENQQLRNALSGGSTFDQMVGPGPRMQRIFQLIMSVAESQATVLVTGPSGTGKELVARAIHVNSSRAAGPFVKVNCAAVPEGLIESELFGHEKGSYTGAYRTTKGKFEAADKGTLLLDEIGEMPLAAQAKLLRVLQDREIERVGSVEPVKVDVRLIATTNVDIEKAVADGKFREDLYFRINVIPIKLPSLTERRDDIPMLSYHFMRRYAKVNGRQIEHISDAAMRFLLHAPYDGNVRELENLIQRAVVMARSDQLELADFFMDDIPPSAQVWAEQGGAVSSVEPLAGAIYSPEPITLDELEKRHILATLKTLDGHRLRTAEQLGISIRTLRNKLNEYKVEGDEV